MEGSDKNAAEPSDNSAASFNEKQISHSHATVYFAAGPPDSNAYTVFGCTSLRSESFIDEAASQCSFQDSACVAGSNENAVEQSVDNSAASSNARQLSHSHSTVYSVETCISPSQVTIGCAIKPSIDHDSIACFVVRSDVFVRMSTVRCMQRWILFQILSNAQDGFSVGTKEVRASMRVSLCHSSQEVARLGL
jgi:hypothetical protein